MTIEVFRMNNYGRVDWYVADKEQAEAIRMITNQKTLGIVAREGLERLGFTLKEVIPPMSN